MGVQSPSKIKPPADCRSAQKSYVMQSMTRTSQQVRQGVLELHNGGTQRGQDIFFECFGSGYSFVINNPKCKSIVIGETIVPVTETPFVYYYPFAPNEYHFLDEDGNELN